MTHLADFLRGVRVVDLSRHLPGPFVTLLLADMGAQVSKIEPPAGDELRDLGPRTASGHSAYFEAVNAGKTTRRVDLKQPAGVAEVLAEVRDADVLIESFRPGVMARLDLDYEAVKAINPGLVYCSLNGFGATGPLSQVAAHDINYLALAGVLGYNTSHFDPPIADYAAALFATVAIIGALHARVRSNLGCHIDVALADAAMALQHFQFAALGVTGIPPQPRQGLLNGGAACYQIYETFDHRRVSLGALEPKFWRAFCVAAHRLDWEARHHDPLPQVALATEVAAMFSALTLAQCNERFTAADCCYAPVLDLAEVIDSPHVRSRGVVRTTEDGETQVLFPVLVNGEPPATRPKLGASQKPVA